ncbi:unnamed protein product [Effrenium voratum]|nr:unnamed protein product [Effrenium voratum]
MRLVQWTSALWWAKAAAEGPELEGFASGSLPKPQRAAAFLDCEGLGDEHIFWPVFRHALRSEGVLGETTLQLAVKKWGEWEDYQEQMIQNGDLDGSSTIRVEGLKYANGSQVETHLRGLIDLPVVFQKASFSHLFDDPPKWGPSDFAGFLACPVGFVLVQYVIFIANKVRGQLEYSLLRDYWEGMVNAFGLIYAIPSYVLDHSESANWGITSFDIAVNLNTQTGSYYTSYDDYCHANPVPPPLLTHWWHDAPHIASRDEEGGLCSGSGPIPVALIGEHGPVNLDHLSTASAALREACGDRDPIVEPGHFFTYLWALEGTSEGQSLRASLRVSWESFWGEPLTKSQGRSDGLPRWSLQGALQALRGWGSREAFLRRARVLICCEPLWLCVLMHAALGPGRLLVRVSMCLLHSFSHVFGEQELPNFWPLVRSMANLPAISAAARISAEMLNFQTGIRPPYVPALSLHVAAHSYAPATSDVLLFRFRLPGAPGFIRVIQMLSEEARAEGIPVPRVVIMDSAQKSLSFQEIGQYRALALLPHVPYAQRLPDVFALGSPTLVPALPLLHKFMWPFAGPFCGRSDPELSRSVDPIAGNASLHPFSPFAFQGPIFLPESFEEDRRYWAQYSEWELWPHLIRFQASNWNYANSSRSARQMLELASMTEEEALERSRRMRNHHAALSESSLRYWRKALAEAVATG